MSENITEITESILTTVTEILSTLENQHTKRPRTNGYSTTHNCHTTYLSNFSEKCSSFNVIIGVHNQVPFTNYSIGFPPTNEMLLREINIK